MIITKKVLPRRAFLSGIGATVALPLLDGMIPAMEAAGKTAAKPAKRLSFIYCPNGKNMAKWTPATEGVGYQLSPIMAPLAPFKDRFLVLSGLNQNAADALPGEGKFAPHERAGATFLTGVHPVREINQGISVDQIVARELGQQTQVASLEMGLHNPDIVGACESGWSCAFTDTLSWRGPTTPMPVENQPRAVFERLFGESTDPAVRMARIRENQSILDSVSEAAARLQISLGPSDRTRMDEYLEAIRDVERRIQLAEQQFSRPAVLESPGVNLHTGQQLPAFERPAGIPEEFGEYCKLMFDLQVLAYQSDLTRVITFMMGREQSHKTFREIGISEVHHALSHHRGDPAKLEQIYQIDLYHSELFAYFLDKMRSTPDGDGSLLDHSMIVFGSGISDGNEHMVQNLPILLAGGGGGLIKGGRHLRYPKDTPMTNLFLTLLDGLGMPVEKFGDSTGKLELLSV